MAVHVLEIEDQLRFRCDCDTCGSQGAVMATPEEAAASFEETPVGAHLCRACSGGADTGYGVLITSQGTHITGALDEALHAIDPNDGGPRAFSLRLDLLDLLPSVGELPNWCVPHACVRYIGRPNVLRILAVEERRVALSNGTYFIRHFTNRTFAELYEPVVVKTRGQRLSEDEL